MKRVKDIRNKEKMMVGSDFSLSGPDVDLEMDYYDYNVHNTNTVPGSYLGMDPAYCVWIPPVAPSEWVDQGLNCEDDNNVDNLCLRVQPDSIEMQVLRHKTADDDLRCKTPISEKFQKECRNPDKEKFKRHSSMSTASSSNRTIMPDDMTPDDDLTIQQALLPDSPIEVQKAVVIREVNTMQPSTKISSLLYKDDLKFADEDESDTAYNSDENGEQTMDEKSLKKLVITSGDCKRLSFKTKLSRKHEKNC